MTAIARKKRIYKRSGEPAPWRVYEATARKVLNDMRHELGLSKVDGKKRLQGKNGRWEIDAQAWSADGERFLVVEAKRYLNKKLDQSKMASLAYTIHDIGSVGGFVVTTQKMQSGATKLAAAENIKHITMAADSTEIRSLAEYMGRVYFGASIVEKANATDTSDAVIGWATPDGKPPSPA